MTGKPCPGGRLLAVRQQGGDPVLFQIADNGAVTLVFPPGPVVNPDHIERSGWCFGTPADNPEQRVIADRQHQPLGKAGGGPSAKRQPEVMNQAFQPPAAPRETADNAAGKPLGEYPCATERCPATRDKAPALRWKRRATINNCTIFPDSGRSAMHSRYRL